MEGKQAVSSENLAQPLEQAKHGASIPKGFWMDWESRLRRELELDVQSFKYEYTSLYGRLDSEWLKDTTKNAGWFSLTKP